MKGGELIAGGADTLVFYDPIKFKDPKDTSWFNDPIKTQEMMEEYPVPYDIKRDSVEKLIKKYRAAVRMISEKGTEMRVHRALKSWFGAKQLNSFVQMHTNVWASNGVYRVDIDATSPNVSGNVYKWEESMQSRYGKYNWYGLITRYQTADIYELSGQKRLTCMGELLRTLLHIDGQFVHFDLHMGNAAIMRDETTVIHDFGRAKIRDYMQPFTDYYLSYPDPNNKRVFRNALIELFTQVKQEPDEMMMFDQYFFISSYLNSEKDKIYNMTNWLNMSSYVHGNEESNKKNLIGNRIPFAMLPKFSSIDVYPNWQEIRYDTGTKRELAIKSDGSASMCFMNPMYETRYHHIARIFDILAVLKGFRPGFGKVSANNTAKKLLDMINTEIPCANREDVERVINECLIEAYKEAGLEYKVTTKQAEIEQAEQYWAKKKELDDAPRMMKPESAAPAAPAATTGGADEEKEKEPKAFTKLDMTPDEVEKEEKREDLKIPADAPEEVKTVMQGILGATVKTKDMADDGLGESGKHKGGTFRRKRLPRLM
jgi:hypothetical protein